MTPRRVGVLVAHTSPLAQPGTGQGGGLNVFVVQTARYLAQCGVGVDILTRASSPAAPPVVELAPGVRVHHLRVGPPRPLSKAEVLAHLDEFAAALLDHPALAEIDLLHSHYWLAGLAAEAVVGRWQLPWVHTFHTIAAVRGAEGSADPPLRADAEQRLARAADAVVVLTPHERDVVVDRLGGRAVVVPPGVDTDTFHPDGAVGRARTPPQLLFVGRLDHAKGPDVAVRALPLVRRHLPDAELTVVGGPSGDGRWTPATLRGLAADLGVADAVRFLEPRPQPALAELYRGADVVLVPSRTETCGFVALEAQACGTPVVASDVGGLRWAVRGGGTLVRAADPAAFADAAVGYLTDPTASRRARQWGVAVSRRRTWTRTAERLAGVYAEVRTLTLEGAV